MTELLHHRGPDAGAYYRDDCAELGHRRLSIIDLVSGGQPMCNEDGRLWIVYNGEIFNHAALRPELERAGHRYKTHCDTEAILHAYEEYGPECLARFRGMFAFAIWDRRDRTLFCARDRLGKKPFYYYCDGKLFAFASEIKALLEHPGISAAPNDELIPEYLAFGYCTGPATLYLGIRKLMPGHFLRARIEDGSLAVEESAYWDIPVAPGTGEEKELVPECRARLEEAVRTRLMSDVPLGVFLSGGVDSSAIAALVSRFASGPVETFSVGYREERFSELGYARLAARHIGSRHHEVTVSMEEFFNALPRLVWHEDEPIAWPSSVPLYFVSRLASEQVKVVLTGEGSDELFAGYGRYRLYLTNRRWMPVYGLLPAGLRQVIRRWVATSGLLSGSLRRKLQHTLVGCGTGIESLYLDNFYAAFSEERQGALLTAGDGLPSPYSSYLRYWQAAQGASPLSQLLYADQKTYLVELLMKQDQMSMAASIESRVPFLDHHFVEFAARVPDHLKLRGSQGKYILKRAIEDLLPKELVYRKKMGFPTPIWKWLRQPSAEPLIQLLRARGGFLEAYIDRSALDELIARHRAGLEDGTDRLWRLLNLQIWGEVFRSGSRQPFREGLLPVGRYTAAS